jgi:dynein heavy chain
MSVENSPASNVLADRLESLNNYLTYSLYENICRSLFEKHKLLFSLMLTIKILQAENKINEIEWRYFLTGAAGEIKIEPNPTTWISENAWPDFYR